MMHTRTRTLAGLGLALGALACVGAKAPEGEDALHLTSSALRPNLPVPAAYVCHDQTHLGQSPPLSWSSGPAGTVGYAITMIDPDANDFVHWAVVGIPPGVTSLPAGASGGPQLPAGAIELPNDFGKKGYGGPCPPPGAPHHYVITVTALGSKVTGPRADAMHQIEADGLASGTMVVTFQRSQ